MEHDFTLVLTGLHKISQEATDKLFEAGCDDATLSVRAGRAYLTFTREAESLRAAIVAAIRDVRAAGYGVLRVDASTLVTQSDIARRIQRTRQLVHQYITGARGPGGFPPPACELDDHASNQNAPLWLWCDVAQWLRQHDMISAAALREAQDVAVINAVLDLSYQKQIEPELTEEMLRTVG